MLKRIKTYVDDLLFLLGCGCILYGLSLMSPIAAWIMAGVMCIGISVMIGRAS